MSENKKKKSNNSSEKKLLIYKSFTIILMLIVLGILVKWAYGKYIEIRTEKMYQEMMSEVNSASSNSGTGNDWVNTENEDTEALTEAPDVEENTESVEEAIVLPDDVDIPEKNLDWNGLHNTNQDIYAWINIPNTQVDYPILQHSSDDTYYLTHNLDGSKGYPGCIYTEKVNYKDFFDFNTIIYGHNMKSGAMFRTLHDFENKDFFEKNKYIYIYTEEEIFVYEIYAAYISNDAHILNTNDFSKELGRQAYLENEKAKAQASGGNYREEVDVTIDSKIITLSTCTSNSNQRFLVQAIRLN